MWYTRKVPGEKPRQRYADHHIFNFPCIIEVGYLMFEFYKIPIPKQLCSFDS